MLRVNSAPKLDLKTETKTYWRSNSVEFINKNVQKKQKLSKDISAKSLKKKFAMLRRAPIANISPRRRFLGAHFNRGAGGCEKGQDYIVDGLNSPVSDAYDQFLGMQSIANR